MKSHIVFEKIKKILGKKSLTVSLLIDKLLEDNFFSNRETARTNVFRLIKSNEIASSSPIAFLNQGFAVAINEKNLKDDCRNMIQNNYGSFDAAIIALDSYGEISYFDLEKLFVLKRNDFKRLSRIIKSIEYIYNCTNDQEKRVLKSNYNGEYDSIYFSFKKQIASIFVNYLKDTNVIFGNKVEFCYKEYDSKQINYLSFDMYTDSNIFSYRNNRSVLVLDIGINRAYSRGELTSFIRRIYQLHKTSGVTVIPFVVCDFISKDVKELANLNKIAVYRLENLFGSRYKEISKEFYKIDNNKLDILEFKNLIQKLVEVSLFEYCKGYLFEYFCYLLIETCIPVNKLEMLQRDFKLKEDNQFVAQFDIVFGTRGEICLCECKSSKYCIGMGTEDTHDSYSYFRKQVRKYDCVNNCTSKMLFFSANGFKRNVDESQDSHRVFNLLDNENPKICISKFSIKNQLPLFYSIWDAYFTFREEKEDTLEELAHESVLS
jgi:hypothetical protein